MGERREQTRQLLEQIGKKQGTQMGIAADRPALQAVAGSLRSAGAPAGGLLVAADSTCPNGVALVREALSLLRFGIEVTVFADAPLAQKVGRCLLEKNLRIPQGPLNGEAFGSARILLVASGQGQLAKGALGLRDTVAADALLCALWHGLAVYTDFSFIEREENGKPCQNAALVALYKSYEKRLTEMGVAHLAKGGVLVELLPLLQGREAPALVTKAPMGRVFITKKDVEDYAGSPEWVLPARAIITAAAKDVAAQRKITLCRQGAP